MLTASETAVTPTSKLRTKTGSVGATIPKPIAIRKAATTRIWIWRGRRGAATSTTDPSCALLSISTLRDVQRNGHVPDKPIARIDTARTQGRDLGGRGVT